MVGKWRLALGGLGLATVAACGSATIIDAHPSTGGTTSVSSSAGSGGAVASSSSGLQPVGAGGGVGGGPLWEDCAGVQPDGSTVLATFNGPMQYATVIIPGGDHVQWLLPGEESGEDPGPNLAMPYLLDVALPCGAVQGQSIDVYGNEVVYDTSYFYAAGGGVVGSEIKRTPLDASGNAVISSSFAGGISDMIVVGGGLYIARNTAIGVVSTNGSMIVDVVYPANPAQIAYHLGRLYWTDISGDAIMSSTSMGADVKVLASTSSDARSFAVDDSGIYWTQAEGVFTTPLTGGTPQQLASGDARQLAIDATHVYFNAPPTTYRVPKAGGPTETLVASDARDLVLDDSNLYFTAADSLFTLPK